MPDQPHNAPQAFRDIAPALAGYTEDVLFGDVWKRPGLSPRDRSLITVACLISLYAPMNFPSHSKGPLEKVTTPEELTKPTTNLPFYPVLRPPNTPSTAAGALSETRK